MEYLDRHSTSDPHPAEIGLPTLSKLGNPIIPDDLDVQKVAASWIETFGKCVNQGDVDGVLAVMVNSAFASDVLQAKSVPDNAIPVYWRDILALTWDFRTFEGTTSIQQFLHDRLSDAKISNVQLGAASLERPFPDLVWIQLLFTFETKVGLASGIVRLAPLPISANQLGSNTAGLNTGDVTWKAFSIFTNLEDLKGFPENLGSRRNAMPNHGKWEDQRKNETAFENKEPDVLIIGGGQSGLDVAARLKALDVNTLVVEKHKRIGDNWRTRYEALCLHDTVWYDHMPYLPFPPTWPIFSPAKKVVFDSLHILANWLESYAEALELNVWTSTTVVSATQDLNSKIWSVKVKRDDRSERVFTMKHVVMAFGLKGGKGYIPQYPGMEKFKGPILHSAEHHKAEDHLGKKVVVIGAATSDHGVDVTMFQRSSTYIMSAAKGMRMLLEGPYSEDGPPIDVADRLNASFPTSMMAGIAHRTAKAIAEVDRETLKGLKSVGFRLNMGIKDAGFLLLAFTKASGYYLDVGASQYIIDGKIKLKNDSQIKQFTETGIQFENGSDLPADVVVFCTGYSDANSNMRAIFGDEVTKNVGDTFGLNEEGEMRGLFRQLPYRGLYSMMGNLAICRFNSKHIALQIKAMEEGLFDGKTYAKQ
ncbi:FAD/NAD-binding domain-containing protein [Crepidotus variabilis]|uniref:FAD/NAD-binding domain-containing protein n=1 Tax=Crepidotus variabilis TaxID=179855 RepID=A0A9P6E406_9AGAR|nr:FAD/NAD-binding domain-containing protein [Crepidotus variabilis]